MVVGGFADGGAMHTSFCVVHVARHDVECHVITIVSSPRVESIVLFGVFCFDN